MSLGFTWTALGLSPCWVINLGIATTLSGDDKNQIDVQAVFFEDPVLLGDPQRRHVVADRAMRDQQFTRLCGESCRPHRSSKKDPNSDPQNFGWYSHF